MLADKVSKTAEKTRTIRSSATDAQTRSSRQNSLQRQAAALPEIQAAVSGLLWMAQYAQSRAIR